MAFCAARRGAYTQRGGTAAYTCAFIHAEWPSQMHFGWNGMSPFAGCKEPTQHLGRHRQSKRKHPQPTSGRWEGQQAGHAAAVRDHRKPIPPSSTSLSSGGHCDRSLLACLGSPTQWTMGDGRGSQPVAAWSMRDRSASHGLPRPYKAICLQSLQLAGPPLSLSIRPNTNSLPHPLIHWPFGLPPSPLHPTH